MPEYCDHNRVPPKCWECHMQRAVTAEARVAELKVDANRLTEFVYRVLDSEGESFVEHCVKPPPDWIEEREPEKWKRAEEISDRLRGKGGDDGN